MIVTCLIGDPVAQSVSPYMYNYFAQRAGFDYYSHIKLRVFSDDKRNLPKALGAVKTLSFSGINITIPYKIEVMKYLDEIDSRAKAAGAVNTIINKNGKLIGYNTDGIGALLAIESRLKKIKSNDRVVVFGAGGAARAIVATISQKTKKIIVLNRKDDFHLAESLKNNLKKVKSQIEILPIIHKNIIKSFSDADFVINATSVGMFPNNKDSILSPAQLSEINLKSPLKNKYFFDAVFNPYTTAFLTMAKKYGANICQGLYMTIYQGAASFELWTGEKIVQKDIEFVHKLIKQKMGIKD